jgi:hypothetical protein
MQKINVGMHSVILTLALLIVMSIISSAAQAKTTSKKRIQFLINEMTETPERQQKALDELTNYDDEVVIYLFPYLSDERLVATKEVKFLNTSPRAFEKYFLTNAAKIDEVVIQYYCWRTAQCTPSSEANNLEKIKSQINSDFKKCRLNNESAKISCLLNKRKSDD